MRHPASETGRSSGHARSAEAGRAACPGASACGGARGGGGPSPEEQLVVLHGLERVLREEVLELRRVLPEQPAPLLLDDDLALGVVLAEHRLAVRLLLALRLVHLAPQVYEALGLALVLLDLHPPLVLVHLLEPVVLGELRQELLADLLLLRLQRRGSLLLHLHLEDVRVLHVLPVLEPLPHLDLLAAPGLRLELLQVQVVAQLLQLLRLLVLRLHLPDHRIQHLLLLDFGPLLLLRQPPLLLALIPSVGLNPLVLVKFCLLHGLLFGLLLHHELAQDLARLPLLVHPGGELLGVLVRDLLDELLDLVLLLEVLRQGLLPRGLLHGDLLLVDVLDPHSLAGLLYGELVLQLDVLEPLVLHVLSNLLLLQPVPLLLHGDFEHLLRPLLVHLGHVQALLEGSELLAAIADAALVYVLAQLQSLPPRELVGQALFKLGDLGPARFVLLPLHVGVVREELAALCRL
mmetsp:Transcript_80052/g.235471  ORF Transcript_80052/g.235471 Transcript_80052/m.235471 type:complete len:462 (+) Transcript_80052:218-1603(+)